MKKSDLQSPSLEGLRQFVLARREQWATDTPDFEQFEHELHARMMAIEREMLAEELARYDVRAKQIEVEGVTSKQLRRPWFGQNDLMYNIRLICLSLVITLAYLWPHRCERLCSQYESCTHDSW